MVYGDWLLPARAAAPRQLDLPPQVHAVVARVPGSWLTPRTNEPGGLGGQAFTWECPALERVCASAQQLGTIECAPMRQLASI